MLLQEATAMLIVRAAYRVRARSVNSRRLLSGGRAGGQRLGSPVCEPRCKTLDCDWIRPITAPDDMASRPDEATLGAVVQTGDELFRLNRTAIAWNGAPNYRQPNWHRLNPACLFPSPPQPNSG